MQRPRDSILLSVIELVNSSDSVLAVQAMTPKGLTVNFVGEMAYSVFRNNTHSANDTYIV